LIIGLFIIQGVDHKFIFDKEINLVLSVVTIIFFAWTYINDKKQHEKTKRWIAFFPTIIEVFIGIGLFTILFIFQQRDKSPTKLYCVIKNVDFNGVSIDFREDGTYKLTSWCLGADYYRGTYVMTDSIITLDENPIINNRLVIRQDGEKDSLGNIEESIYQINKNGQIIENAIDFRVLGKK
jgi:hypothetical protein